MFSDNKTLINQYMNTLFTREMRDEINASFMVLDAFGEVGYEDVLMDIIYDPESDEEEVGLMKFVSVVHEYLDKVLRAHQVYLAQDTKLVSKNQILSVLYRIQYVEDPVPPLKVLESYKDNEEKISDIVSMYSTITTGEAMEVIEEVGEDLIDNMSRHLYTLEEARTELPDRNTELEQNIKDYFDIIGKDCLAYEMLGNGIMPGLSIKIYYPYIRDKLVLEDDNSTAKNMLSLFLLAEDTYRDPLGIYKKYGEVIIPDRNRFVKIEVLMGALLNKLHQYQGAKDVARSVSNVQHQE